MEQQQRGGQSKKSGKCRSLTAEMWPSPTSLTKLFSTSVTTSWKKIGN
jgi:hypothetical protein